MRPLGCYVHVPLAEVETIAHVAVVLGHRDFFRSPSTVSDLANVDVEVAVWLRGNVSEPVAVRRENRVRIDVLVIRQRVALPGLDVQNLQLNGLAAVIRGIGEPFSTRRPVRRRVVLLVIGELLRNTRARVYAPDGAGHGNRDPFSVR